MWWLHPRDYYEDHLIKTGQYEKELLDFMEGNASAGDCVAIAGISFGMLPLTIVTELHPWVLDHTDKNLHDYVNALEEKGYKCRTLDGRIPKNEEDLHKWQLVAYLGNEEPNWLLI